MAMDEDKLARSHQRQRHDHEAVGAKLDEGRLAAIRQALSRGGSDADVARQVGASALGTREHTEAVRQHNERVADLQKQALDRPGKARQSREIREDKLRSAERRSEAMQQRLHEQTGRTLDERAPTRDAKTPQESYADTLARGRQELNQAGRQSQQSREQGGRDRVRSR